MFHSAKTDPTIGETAAKAITTAALYGIAGYLASQSARHRRREEIAKTRELDLIVFGPFIADLDDVRQQEARAALVDRLFGHDWGNWHGKEPALSKDSISLMGRILDLVTPRNEGKSS